MSRPEPTAAVPSADAAPRPHGPTVPPSATAARSEAANGLAPHRARLDELDERIAHLLGERFDVCREVADYKSEHGIAMMQPERVRAVRERYLRRGAEVGLPPDFTAALFELLIAATCKLEDELMARSAAAGGEGKER